MSQTVRQMIIDILLEGPATAKELSARVSIPEKEVFPHLAHIRKSPHSIGFSGRQMASDNEGSSTLDFPLIHKAQLQDEP